MTQISEKRVSPPSRVSPRNSKSDDLDYNEGLEFPVHFRFTYFSVFNPKKYKCDECGKEFRSENTLRIHKEGTCKQINKQ